MSHNASESGKGNQFLVIIVAGLMVLLVVFGLSKIIPRTAIPKISPSPTPVASPGASSQPEANTYTNTNYHFSVTYPLDWSAQEINSTTLHRLFFVGFTAPDHPTAILASVEVKDQPVTDVITEFRNQISQNHNLRIDLEREVRIGSDYAKQIAFTDSSSKSQTTFRFAANSGKTFVLSAMGTDSATLSPILVSLLNSFTFTVPSPNPANRHQ